MAKFLEPAVACHRLQIARQLYDRFLADMKDDPAKAKSRLIAGIQVAIRDATDGHMTPAPLDDGS